MRNRITVTMQLIKIHAMVLNLSVHYVDGSLCRRYINKKVHYLDGTLFGRCIIQMTPKYMSISSLMVFTLRCLHYCSNALIIFDIPAVTPEPSCVHVILVL